MKDSLEKQLYDKYPKIFRQKDLPMTQTCMCWGINCGNGWYKIIDDLCQCLQERCDSKIQHLEWEHKNNKKLDVTPEELQIEASQVKQKFGGLRFYTDKSDEYADGIIHYAEHLAQKTCEECGSMNEVKQTSGWIKPLCKKCYRKWEWAGKWNTFLYCTKLSKIRTAYVKIRMKHFPNEEDKNWKRLLKG